MGFPPEDIIFDPNIFAVATGIEEHAGYGVHRGGQADQDDPARSQGLRWRLQPEFPPRKQLVREAMHSVFLYHAIRAGMDMGIVNAGVLAVYAHSERPP